MLQTVSFCEMQQTFWFYLFCLVGLTLSPLGKSFSRRQFEIFYCIKCQILFSGKNRENIINLSSAEVSQRVVDKPLDVFIIIIIIFIILFLFIYLFLFVFINTYFPLHYRLSR